MFLYKHFLSDRAGGELDDIVRNIGYMLRCKEGCGSFLRGFGITETGYRTPEEMILTLSREIRECIAKYETRVEIIEIEEVYHEGGRVSLQVHLRVHGSKERLGISLAQGGREISVDRTMRLAEPG